jgi:predicted Zn-dependent protease
VGRCGSAEVLACAIIWRANGVLLEADLLFNVHLSWMTNSFFDRDRFDIEGVATHEFGHIVGLAHVNSLGEVMYPSEGAGDVSDRKLGRGDAEFVNRKY